MTLFVDTSVWSLAFRRDVVSPGAEVTALRQAIDAVELRNRCRRAGLQIGTIDALLAQLCVRHALALLTADKDFVLAASQCPLRLWQPAR